MCKAEKELGKVIKKKSILRSCFIRQRVSKGVVTLSGITKMENVSFRIVCAAQIINSERPWRYHIGSCEDISFFIDDSQQLYIETSESFVFVLWALRKKKQFTTHLLT